MIRLLRYLIWGDAHLHKWKPYGHMVKGFINEDDTMPVARRQSFQCEVCGKIRIFDI